MKYLTTILSLLFISHFTDAEVLKLRAFNSALFCKDEEPYYVNDLDALVVIDETKEKITIYTKTTVEIDLVKDLGTERDKDNNLVLFFKGVDAEGKECEVEWIILEKHTNLQVSTLVIHYPTCNLVYRLKVNN